jgi:hypothetical protein
MNHYSEKRLTLQGVKYNFIKLPGRLEFRHWFSNNAENNTVMLVLTNRIASARKIPSGTQGATTMTGTSNVSLSKNAGNVSDRIIMKSLVNFALAMIAYNPPSILKYTY